MHGFLGISEARLIESTDEELMATGADSESAVHTEIAYTGFSKCNCDII